MIETFSKKVLVDMDGVTANFDAEVISRMAERYPEAPNIKIDTRQNFYIADDYPEKYAAIVKIIVREPGFYGSLPIVDGALEGWQRIIDLGFKPQFCSSPISKSDTCVEEKIQWINKNFVPVFGKYVVQQAIIDSDKYLYDGIALIDDKPEVKKFDEAKWQHIVFDRPYNQNVDRLRLRGWRDENLGELLDQAEKIYRDLGSISLR